MLDVSPPDLVSVAREAGFDLLSLRVIAPIPGEWPWPMTAGAPTLEETARRLYLTSVRVLSVEVVLVVTGVPAQRLRTRRNPDVKAMDAAIS